MIYRAIIFDLDGTLVNSLEDLADSTNKVLLGKGFKTHELEAYQYFVGNGIRNLIREALPEECRDEEFISHCYELMMEEYRGKCLVKTKPYEGITELLLALNEKGIKLAVYSNKVDDLTKKIVATLFPEIKFEVILGATPDRPRKPNPEGAIYISEELKLEPGEILFVGDSDVDMQTANAAGMYALGVLWGYRAKEVLLAKGAKRLASVPRDILKTLTS